MIARTRAPRLVSTIWGLVFLLASGAILLAVDYRFSSIANTAALFAGFAAWAVFLALGAEWTDRRERARQQPVESGDPQPR